MPQRVHSRSLIGRVLANSCAQVHRSDSQSVSYFTVPPRAHPSTGSQSGSAAPGLTQVLYRVHVLAPPGATQLAVLSQVRSISPSGQLIYRRLNHPKSTTRLNH